MSYNIGLSGLQTTNQSLNVISQNIANVSTAGYKAGSSLFSALYAGGSGSGVELTKVEQDFNTDGTPTYTGDGLNMAISGQGFFVVTTPQGLNAYTRAGVFERDANNFITTPSGYKLQGYSVDADGNLLTGVVTDLRISTSNVSAKASTSLDFSTNLDAETEAVNTTTYPFDPTNANSYNYSYTSGVYDSLGVEHQLTQYFVKTGPNTWDSHYFVDGTDTTVSQPLTFNTDGSIASPLTPVNLTLNPAGADPMTLAIDYSDSSQYASDFVASYDTDGYGSGSLAGVDVDDDGSVFAIYSNGVRMLQGQVVLAGFANPNGLAQGQDTTWSATTQSGIAQIGAAGSGVLGTLSSGRYESSNVNLSNELVSLMTAQRNYQANAKSISTDDQMTQVLFNSW